MAKFVPAGTCPISPERVPRLDVDEFGGQRAEEQSAQVPVLPELEVQDFVHLE
jgi:hypothetical protein